ncbi:uncharacterized protein LOC123413649 isoform X3 [Hordeum vulgare subsp. vulgare]|uniref:uncharacterized protein LOC123413649 isoform X3 n=1 Tax=Hordeum vulgare subsp. vulgare TaxID=112509 RepID=UPI001D1A4B36|nr:uncharacterized protein LOC123413649 isoform X3 [Hordeum vulgare subsp. vulgare]
MSSELPLLQLGAASPRMPLVTPTATGPACSTKTSRCFSLHRAHLRHHRRRPTFIPLLNRGSKRDEALILEEVSKYNSKDGCWLIIVGKRWVVASFHHHLPLGNSFYLCTKYTNFNYSSLHVQNTTLVKLTAHGFIFLRIFLQSIAIFIASVCESNRIE